MSATASSALTPIPGGMMLSPGGKRNGWTVWHLVGMYAFVAIGIAVTWSAWVEIFNTAAKDEESSHIFLVPLIAAWLIWVRRERFRFCYPTGQFVGPIFIAIGAVVGWIGYNHAILSFAHLGAVLVVVGCLLSIVGKDVLMRFLPAFVVLVFLVPIPVRLRLLLAIPLQSYLAQLTEFIFALLGSEIYRSGNQLYINDTPVAIAEACNGMRMVFALGLVSYAFAFGTPLRNYVRVIVIAAAPLTALLCNVLRMIPTVWFYGMSEGEVLGVDGKSFAEQFHNVAGWFMLVIAFLLLMSIIRILRWALIPVTPYTLAYD